MIRRPVRPVLCLLTALALPALVAATSHTALAADPPEALLDKESVAYVRFDGFAPERAAYQKTILAGLLRDQFGPLIDDLSTRILDAVGPQQLGERLLDGADPDQLLKVQVALKQLPHLGEYLDEHGFAAGLEVVDPTAEIPQFQITIVFPEGGEPQHRSALFGGLRLLGLANEIDVVETQQSGRAMLGFEQPGGVRVAMWQQGPHVMMVVGTLDFDRAVEVADGKRENLLANATFEQLGEYDAYPTLKRGFVDVDGVAEIVNRAFPPFSDALVQLGLRDLKNVRFHVGFQDQLVRTTFLLDTPGERRGLLQVLTPKGQLDPNDLPPLPVDAAAVMASSIDLAGTYDSLFASIDGTLKVFSPLAKNTIQDGLDEMKKVLGVDLRTDVLATLDSPIVFFNSPGDGPLNMGMGLAIKVKNPEHLEQSLDTIVRSLGSFTGTQIQSSSRELHGGTLHMVSGNANNGFFFVPSYTIHDGWLVVALFPAPVQGFLYRSQEKTAGGETPARWQMPAAAKAALADATKGDGQARLTGLYVTDPRPTAQAVISIAPIFVQFVTQFAGGGGSDFDISLIPNAQSVTDPLYENVTVVIDDGRTIRYEGYATLPMPFQVTGLESYAYLAVIPLFGFFSF